MSVQGVDSSSMEDYMEGFRYAAPPYASAGIELERIVMLLIQLGNVRFGWKTFTCAAKKRIETT